MVPREQELAIVTASDAKYERTVKKNIENCEKFGHKLVVYDLGGLGFGIKRETNKDDFKIHKGCPIMRISFKPHIILDALKEYKYVMWVDGDAFINRKIDIPFDFDIGLTARKHYNKKTAMGFINAGVVMLKNSPKVYNFVQEWTKKCQLSDQGFLNQKVIPHISKDESFEDREKESLNLSIDGLRIKVFPAAKYNDYYAFDKDSYVHHLKGILSESVLERNISMVVLDDKLRSFDIE